MSRAAADPPEGTGGGTDPAGEGPVERGPIRLSVGEDGVAHLVLDRPEKRNALNAELVESLIRALRETAADPEVRVVLLSGEGRDFCAGADLAELERVADMGPEASLADANRMGELFRSMRRHPRPIVAAVRGRALAGGAGLAAACDLVVAEEGAEFGFPEVHLGFVPAMVMTMLRRKLTEGRAFELAVRGERISAAEAERAGLVNRVFPSDGFDGMAREWAAGLARRPASAVELTKRLLYGIDGMSFDEAIARGAEVNVLARLTEACREGVRAFLGRAREGGNRGDAG